jgi:hypothetical protein
MRLSGKSALSQLRFNPYYFVDENLTPLIATSLAYCGYDCDCVQKYYQNEKRKGDPLIIEHLGNFGREKSIWVTSDTDPKKIHARYIFSKSNSVLWVFRPAKSGLSILNELLLMCLVIEDLDALLAKSNHPLYLRASLLLPHKKGRLETLISPLTDKSMKFKRLIFH